MCYNVTNATENFKKIIIVNKSISMSMNLSKNRTKEVNNDYIATRGFYYAHE